MFQQASTIDSVWQSTTKVPTPVLAYPKTPPPHDQLVAPGLGWEFPFALTTQLECELERQDANLKVYEMLGFDPPDEGLSMPDCIWEQYRQMNDMELADAHTPTPSPPPPTAESSVHRPPSKASSIDDTKTATGTKRSRRRRYTSARSNTRKQSQRSGNIGRIAKTAKPAMIPSIHSMQTRSKTRAAKGWMDYGIERAKGNGSYFTMGM